MEIPDYRLFSVGGHLSVFVGPPPITSITEGMKTKKEIPQVNLVTSKKGILLSKCEKCEKQTTFS